MTVQTQGLLMAVSGMNAGKSFANNAKVSQNVSFQDVMVQNGDDQNDVSNQKELNVNTATNNSKETVATPNERPIKEVKNNIKDDVLEPTDVSELEEKTMDFLQDQLGLTEEQLTDIMQQLGITPADLIQLIQPETTEITPTVNQDVLQSLVLEVHGIENPAVLLTNEDLLSEIKDLISGIEDILTGNEVPQQNLDTSNDSIQTEIADFQDVIENVSNQESVQNVAITGKQEDTTNEPEIKEDVVEVSFQKSDLVAENTASENDANTETTSEDENKSLDLKTRSSGESNQDLTANEMFTQKFTQAFEKLGRTTEVAQDMSKVVMQVVEQIKVRVLPETTKMELTLNPETLGKVNVSVSSQNGATTATFTVQNQTAKEALESQITMLKETFAEKGLKVESVEVNVSEFGFQNENQTDQEAQTGQKARKRFHVVEDMGLDEEVEEENTINADGSINYTA